MTLPRLRFNLTDAAEPLRVFRAPPPGGMAPRPGRLPRDAALRPMVPRETAPGPAGGPHSDLAARSARLAGDTPSPSPFPAPAFPDPASPFPCPTELWLEVGFGGGEHAVAQIAAHPKAALIACEVFENGICSLLSRLVPEGAEATAPLPSNLRIWPDDARVLLRHLPDACLDRLFLLFPDPWPKARHAKRRFVHLAHLPLLARVLKPGGIWRVASDDPIYQAWVTEIMAAQMLFDAPPPVAVRPEGWPPTRYEAKALREGRTPLYWTLTRRG